MNKNRDIKQDKEDGNKTIEDFSDESNIIGEFWGFLKENKKFWLIPILLILLLLGLLIVVGGTSASPFIYALF